METEQAPKPEEASQDVQEKQETVKVPIEEIECLAALNSSALGRALENQIMDALRSVEDGKEVEEKNRAEIFLTASDLSASSYELGKIHTIMTLSRQFDVVNDEYKTMGCSPQDAARAKAVFEQQNALAQKQADQQEREQQTKK